VDVTKPAIAVVGHPFGPLGISRVPRCTFASFRAAGETPRLIDVWGDERPVGSHAETLAPFITNKFGDVNLFHLNGDEIERALDHLGGLPPGWNVIHPMWELPNYPAPWARQLELFDEVWAASAFIADSIRPAVSTPVVTLPLATEIRLGTPHSRRYYGIPESSYAFLFFFDLRSFIDRKNPWAVLDAFEYFLEKRPWALASLVIKVHGSANAPVAAAALRDRVADLGSRVVLIDRVMEEREVHGLLYRCDAFVSLHRAEGVGLGLAEAMFLGKPVVGTGYSGNLDFMRADNSRLISYRLVPVAPDAYPFWEDQMWADPDVDEAAAAMLDLYDHPEQGRALGRAASQHMRTHFSFRASGLRYVDHLLST